MGRHSYKGVAVLPLAVLAALVAFHDPEGVAFAEAAPRTIELTAGAGDDLPFSLTSSDGVGLRPVSVSSQTIVSEPLACQRHRRRFRPARCVGRRVHHARLLRLARVDRAFVNRGNYTVQ